jgi:hypothetical protein
MIFLGLHLDQSQGMFFAQPLLLTGVASLVPFVRARPWIASFWAALYLSLIVPNAMELARYGLGGPAGRFAWSAMWLWLVPIGFVLAKHKSRAEPVVRALVIADACTKPSLALRWIPFPSAWTNVDDPGTSVFPRALTGWLPSFATWDFVSSTIRSISWRWWRCWRSASQARRWTVIANVFPQQRVDRFEQHTLRPATRADRPQPAFANPVMHRPPRHPEQFRSRSTSTD